MKVVLAWQRLASPCAVPTLLRNEVLKKTLKSQVNPKDGGTYLCLANYADSPLKAEVEVSVFSEYLRCYAVHM